MERPVVYEVARRKDASEVDLLASLAAAGFEVVRNYEALPRNYRVAPLSEMSREDAKAALNAIPELEDDAVDGDDEVRMELDRGRELTSTLTRPLDVEHALGAKPNWGLMGTAALAYENLWNRQWGIAVCTDPSPLTPPFTGVKPGDYSYTVHRNGNGVDYYILDTGVNVCNPEFDEGEFGPRAELIWDGFYETNEDDNGHGTGMATCAVGKTIGVGFHCRVFGAKGLAANNGGQTSALIDGMNALVAHFTADTSGRPGVMNNSWSTTSSMAYTAAVDAAVDAGMVMVASAGNDYSDIARYPANYNDVLSIGALDLDLARADFSNHGSRVDVFSPGRDILQGYKGRSLHFGNGTSPAGGLATGLICCMLQGYRRPQGRTDVLAVYDYVRAQAVALRKERPDDTAAGTTRDVIWLNPAPQPDAARIPGLNNMLTPWRSGIGGESFQRQFSRRSGIGPALTPARPGRRFNDAIEIGADVEPRAVTTETDLSGARPWRFRNDGVVNTQDPALLQKLGRVADPADGSVEGEPIVIPGREGLLAFVGSQDASTAVRYLNIPLGMSRDAASSPLEDLFTNLGFETGDTTGWTTSGTLQVKVANGALEAYAGLYFIEGAGADAHAYQDAVLTDRFSPGEIDAGRVRVQFSGMQGTSTAQTAPDDDASRVRMIALDETDTEIATILDTGIRSGEVVGWTDPGRFGSDALVPPGTRKVRLRYDWIFRAGTIVNAPISGTNGWFYAVTAEGEQALREAATGRAWLRTRYMHRSFGADSDDQLQVYVIFLDKTGQEITTEMDEYRSPGAWVEQVFDAPIPGNAVAFDVRFRANLRAGSLINVYSRDHGFFVSRGQHQRPDSGSIRSVPKGAGVEVSYAGAHPGATALFMT